MQLLNGYLTLVMYTSIVTSPPSIASFLPTLTALIVLPIKSSQRSYVQPSFRLYHVPISASAEFSASFRIFARGRASLGRKSIFNKYTDLSEFVKSFLPPLDELFPLRSCEDIPEPQVPFPERLPSYSLKTQSNPPPRRQSH